MPGAPGLSLRKAAPLDACHRLGNLRFLFLLEPKMRPAYTESVIEEAARDAELRIDQRLPGPQPLRLPFMSRATPLPGSGQGVSQARPSGAVGSAGRAGPWSGRAASREVSGGQQGGKAPVHGEGALRTCARRW